MHEHYVYARKIINSMEKIYKTFKGKKDRLINNEYETTLDMILLKNTF